MKKPRAALLRGQNAIRPKRDKIWQEFFELRSVERNFSFFKNFKNLRHVGREQGATNSIPIQKLSDEASFLARVFQKKATKF